VSTDLDVFTAVLLVAGPEPEEGTLDWMAWDRSVDVAMTEIMGDRSKIGLSRVMCTHLCEMYKMWARTKQKEIDNGKV